MHSKLSAVTALLFSTVAAAALVGAIAVQGRACGMDDGQWRMYSGDNAATKYSPLDEINSANVGTLKVAWRRSHTPPDAVGDQVNVGTPPGFGGNQS